MDPEESICLRRITNEVNARILEGDERDPSVIVEDIIKIVLDDPLTVDPVEHYQGVTDVHAAMLDRRSARLDLARNIAETFSEETHGMEELLAAAEVVSARFTNRFGDKLESWLVEGDLPTVELLEGERLLVGKPLKCLLLLSLQARACLTAGEATTLLFSGYLAGAYGRTRSLYEMMVITTALATDESYETCERFHASAVFEHLRELEQGERRARSLNEPFEASIDLAEAKAIARATELRYGTMLRHNYGWAAHTFSPTRKRVTFADLESSFGIADVFRAHYLTMNHSIHAGPSSTITHTDFSTKRLNQTRPSMDGEVLRIVANNIIFFITRTSEVAGRQLAAELGAYDDLLLLGNMRMIEARLHRKLQGPGS